MVIIKLWKYCSKRSWKILFGFCRTSDSLQLSVLFMNRLNFAFLTFFRDFIPLYSICNVHATTSFYHQYFETWRQHRVWQVKDIQFTIVVGDILHESSYALVTYVMFYTLFFKETPMRMGNVEIYDLIACLVYISNYMTYYV
jgi:hypothetical protein